MLCGRNAGSKAGDTNECVGRIEGKPGKQDQEEEAGLWSV